MAGPTPAQILKTQANLANMQDLNDFVYNEGQSRVLNAFFLLTEKDDSDPGLTIGLNLVEALFKGIGSLAGPIGVFVANFAAGMVHDWGRANHTPPGIKGTFASLEIRLQKTSLAVDAQLALYHSAVSTHWDTSFKFDGQTVKLSDLSTGDFPAKTDPEFEKIAAASIAALDREIWATVLRANFIITLWQLNTGPTIFPGGSENDPPIAYDERFIKDHPAYYQTWKWIHTTGCGGQTGWQINEFNVGTGGGLFNDGSLNNHACAYLFRDSAPGVIINKDGLFDRKTVFTALGIKATTKIVGSEVAAPQPLSEGYLAAQAEGKTFTKLLESLGRAAVEKKILDRAATDPVFRQRLAIHPRQTLEEFFAVKFPEAISLNIVVEQPHIFGLVIPGELPDGHPAKS